MYIQLGSNNENTIFLSYFSIHVAGLRKYHNCIVTNVKTEVFKLFPLCDGYLFLPLGDGGDSIKMISEGIGNMYVAKSLRLNNADIHLEAGRENI